MNIFKRETPVKIMENVIGKSALVLGIVSMFGSFLLLSKNITGKVVLEVQASNGEIIGATLAIIAIILLFYFLKTHKSFIQNKKGNKKRKWF